MGFQEGISKTYIVDVAYQTLVVKEAYPNLEIHSEFLLLPDKAKRTSIEGLWDGLR